MILPAKRFARWLMHLGVTREAVIRMIAINIVRMPIRRTMARSTIASAP